MSERQTATASNQRVASDWPVVRMDALANPYGPSIAVAEALASLALAPAASTILAETAVMVGISTRQVLLANGIDELLEAVVLAGRQHGPAVIFPPSSPDIERRLRRHQVPAIHVQRQPSFALDLTLEIAADLPVESWAYVMSPNQPTGNLLDLADAIRLARACSMVVIDERYGGFAGRTLVPLAREFENVIVLQSFDTWAGLTAFPAAYAVGQPALLAEISQFLARSELASGTRTAIAASLQDRMALRANVQRLRQERSRLYRTLRKLNMVTPLPSWANFMLMRAERSSAAAIADGLSARGITVHRPLAPELSRYLRVTAGLPEDTDVLKRALIDVGIEL